MVFAVFIMLNFDLMYGKNAVEDLKIPNLKFLGYMNRVFSTAFDLKSQFLLSVLTIHFFPLFTDPHPISSLSF